MRFQIDKQYNIYAPFGVAFEKESFLLWLVSLLLPNSVF
ncbi:hypothetical protein T11_8506 [Trichinella zimbabwensis]|uniref:Uncharacterized protein n=1 Tax=Trichinella zimbabwensis TaxID=268475 RepID=A0A0V1GGD9_9BILA|nr:hypothetical protein T11_15832 [Trichinella zimbabwensis]KRY97634.1 hypothetical protein T11_8506 [Trichinella zimbabwensis]